MHTWRETERKGEAYETEPGRHVEQMKRDERREQERELGGWRKIQIKWLWGQARSSDGPTRLAVSTLQRLAALCFLDFLSLRYCETGRMARETEDERNQETPREIKRERRAAYRSKRGRTREVKEGEQDRHNLADKDRHKKATRKKEAEGQRDAETDVGSSISGERKKEERRERAAIWGRGSYTPVCGESKSPRGVDRDGNRWRTSARGSCTLRCRQNGIERERKERECV